MAERDTRKPKVGMAVVLHALPASLRFAFQGLRAHAALVTAVRGETVDLYVIPAHHSPFALADIPHVSADTADLHGAWDFIR
jgi:hypothetical protein